MEVEGGGSGGVEGGDTKGVAGISTGIACPLGSRKKSCNTVAEGEARGSAGAVTTLVGVAGGSATPPAHTTGATTLSAHSAGGTRWAHTSGTTTVSVPTLGAATLPVPTLGAVTLAAHTADATTPSAHTAGTLSVFSSMATSVRKNIFLCPNTLFFLFLLRLFSGIFLFKLSAAGEERSTSPV